MSEKLKPCPFCGGEPRIYEHVNKWFGGSWHIECLEEHCGCGTCHHETQDIAIEVWNKRTDDLRRAVEVELAMTAVANEDASSDWIDGFEHAWKRVRAALGETK